MDKALERIADPVRLAWMWRKQLRSPARSQRLPDFHLIHDPLENLAFEWDLTGAMRWLSEELQSYGYRANSPSYVRGAKTVGLTRPIAHLAFRDAVVYKSLVSHAESALARSTPPWARMGRRDEDEGGTAGESGWFRAWLARQKKIWVITATCEWLVETDIANYFPTIGVDQICDHVRSDSNLTDAEVRLLRHILERLTPLMEYRRLAAGGLPQEYSESSRVLAHSYLAPLDRLFEDYGSAGLYTRWVDDIIVGAKTWPEALQIVSRVQLGLEKLGLYPNASKTRIYRRSEFVTEYMKEENDYLGELESTLGIPSAQPVREFRRRLINHINLPRPRPKGWARVTRRYYTYSKRLQDDLLLRHWGTHLLANPESAGHIFEYLRIFALTHPRITRLESVLDQFGGVYQDVEVLAMEYLATASIDASRSIRRAAARVAVKRLKESDHFGDAVAAAASVVLAKHATPETTLVLKGAYDTVAHADSLTRRQLLVIGLALGWAGEPELSAVSLGSGDEVSRHVRFIRELTNGNPKAIDMALGVVKPTERHDPKRYGVRPRLLFLVPTLATVVPHRFLAESLAWLHRLESNPHELRDRSAERWIRAGRRIAARSLKTSGTTP